MSSIGALSCFMAASVLNPTHQMEAEMVSLFTPHPPPLSLEFGRYRLLRWMGDGEMARVFLAVRNRPDGPPRKVVVKILTLAYVQGLGTGNKRLQDFHARDHLEHPNLVETMTAPPATDPTRSPASPPALEPFPMRSARAFDRSSLLIAAVLLMMLGGVMLWRASFLPAPIAPGMASGKAGVTSRDSQLRRREGPPKRSARLFRSEPPTNPALAVLYMSTSSKAVVFVDGHALAGTGFPRQTQLQPGVHRVEFRPDQGAFLRQTLTVEAGDVARCEADFLGPRVHCEVVRLAGTGRAPVGHALDRGEQ